MPATTFHFDCKPDVPNELYKTLPSKFDGTCSGCSQPFAQGDKIAYFFSERPAGGSRPPHKNAVDAAATTDLENKVKVLESKLIKVTIDYKDRLDRIDKVVDKLIPLIKQAASAPASESF